MGYRTPHGWVVREMVWEGIGMLDYDGRHRAGESSEEQARRTVERLKRESGGESDGVIDWG